MARSLIIVCVNNSNNKVCVSPLYIQFLAMPTCLDGVTPRELVWKSSEGKLLDKVPVYFHDKEELKHVEYSDGTLTTSNILGMANRHWKTGSNGVPQFSVAEDGLARLHVRFKRKKGRLSLGLLLQKLSLTTFQP